MYDRVLKSFRQCVRANRYVMTLHADEEADNDELSVFDVERVILTGRIVERQVDRKTGEDKYRIKGPTWVGGEMCAVVKLGPSGKMVIITVYALWGEDDPDE